MNHKAIYKLYPNVKYINAEVPYDENNNVVTIDESAVNAWRDPEQYKYDRAEEYPDFKEYLDGIVKGDQAQIDKYIADCQAVKAKYPKPTE
jgi:hypothetical protein